MTAFWKARQRMLAPWLFLAPGALMFVFYVIAPVFQSVSISFYDWDGIGTVSYTHLSTSATGRKTSWRRAA